MHNNIRELQETSTYSLYAWQNTTLFTLHWWRIRCPMEGVETNSGSSVADCVHTAIFQNLRENHVPYCAMRTESREKSTHTDLRSASTAKENR